VAAKPITFKIVSKRKAFSVSISIRLFKQYFKSRLEVVELWYQDVCPMLLKQKFIRDFMYSELSNVESHVSDEKLCLRKL